jgi:hypothetical protein
MSSVVASDAVGEVGSGFQCSSREIVGRLL